MPPKWKIDINLPPTGLLTTEFLLCTCFLYKNSSSPKVRGQEDIASPPGQCVQLCGCCKLAMQTGIGTWQKNSTLEQKKWYAKDDYNHVLSTVILWTNIWSYKPASLSAILCIKPIVHEYKIGKDSSFQKNTYLSHINSSNSSIIFDFHKLLYTRRDKFT